MFVPRALLKPDAAHLFDFQTNDERSRMFAIQASFVARAMSNDKIRPRHMDGVPATHLIFGGKIVPRMRFFVETVLRRGLRSHLARDPATPEEKAAFREPEPAVMYNLLDADNVVGFRFHWLIIDPFLHPATMFKWQIYQN